MVIDTDDSGVLASVSAVEYTTPSGLVVHDKRARAFPRDVDPNGNPAIGTVGPDVPAGFGDTHVMYDGCGVPPPMVQAWAGWPVEWATPQWGSLVGLGEIMRRQSTVFAAIDLQAKTLATMPPYKTRDGRMVQRAEWMRNPQPQAYTGWIEAIRQIVFSYLGCGEVLLWAVAKNPIGEVLQWVMLNPGWVNVELVPGSANVRRYSLGGLDITDDVLHIRYTSWPGDAHGHGPLEAAARALFGAEALEAYAANLATRGGIPWAVLKSPRTLTAQQAAEMRTQYVWSRMSAMGAPAVLSGGIELTPLTINPKDMALLELRQFDEARLSVLLGVPPFMLALPSGGDSMTYKNVEGIYDYHWRSALRFLAASLMEAITNWAFVDPAETAELNRDEYIRPQFEDYVTALAALHGIVEVDANGVERRGISIDEIRATLRLDVADGVADDRSSLAVPA